MTLMTNVVWMPFKNGEAAIELLQQNHPGQLMGNGDFAQGKNHGGGPKRLLGKTIGRANREQ